MEAQNEPDWDQPVRISERLAEQVALTLGKLGSKVTAEQIRAGMARPPAGRDALGHVIADALKRIWAEGGLARNDMYVGFESEPEEVRLQMERARLDRRHAEAQRRGARIRELLDSGDDSEGARDEIRNLFEAQEHAVDELWADVQRRMQLPPEEQ